MLAKGRLRLGERSRGAGERAVAGLARAVHGALPALVEPAQALRVCGVEVAACLVADLVHGGIIGGTPLAHLRYLLVAFLGELVAVRLTDLLGGIGLGVAPVVGQGPVEEAVVLVDLVAAVLRGAL